MLKNILYKNIVWYYWVLRTLLFVMSYKNTGLFWHTENMYLLNMHFTCIPYTVAKTSTLNSFLKDLLVKVYDLYFSENRERKIIENCVCIAFMLQFFIKHSLISKGKNIWSFRIFVQQKCFMLFTIFCSNWNSR